MVERIQSESSGLLCPELANTLEGGQAAETFEALREIVGIEERGEVRAKALVSLVVETPNRGVLDGAVHPFDLAVRPGVVEFGEAMVDAELGACQVKGVSPEGLPISEPLLNLPDTPAAMRRCELKAVVRQNRVNSVGHVFDEPSEEVRCGPVSGPFVEFCKGELADPIDRNEQIQLALLGPDLREIDVDVPKRIRLELPTWRRALGVRQTADAVALEETVQRGSSEMRDRRLEGLEAIVERQRRVSTKRHDQGFFVR